MPRLTGANNIRRSGTANPTVPAKNMIIIHETKVLICVCQRWCECGTLTKHMPAPKAPSRWEPMRNSGTQVMYVKSARVPNIVRR